MIYSIVVKVKFTYAVLLTNQILRATGDVAEFGVLRYARDMNRYHLTETRRADASDRPIHGGSASASVRMTVSVGCSQSMVLLVNGTVMKFYQISKNN